LKDEYTDVFSYFYICMKQIVFILVLFAFLFSSVVEAQYTGNELPVPPPLSPSLFKKENLFWGGDISAYFSIVSQVSVAPTIGYRFNDRIEAGLRASYMVYYGEGVSASGGYGSVNYYGGSLYARVFISPVVFAQAEYEILNVPSANFFETRTDVESRLIGGGMRRQIGQNSYYLVTILWDLDNANTSSPYYGDPLTFRIGFNFGF
jgi:hypothetical protein